MNAYRIINLVPRLTCLVAVVFYFAGCGKSVVEEVTETAIESGLPDGSKVEIGNDGGTIKIQGPDGTVSMETGESVALPANFPTDIPIPDGVTWKMVHGTQSEGNEALVVQGTLAKPISEVATFMRDKLPAQGWELVSSFQQTGEAEMLSFKKGEVQLSVSVSKDGDNSSLLISKG